MPRTPDRSPDVDAMTAPTLDLIAGGYAPTGTWADALEAATEIQKLIRRPAHLATSSDMISGGMGRTLGKPEFASLVHGWDVSTRPGAALMYVSADIGDHINDTCDDVPEPETFADLRLPPNGLVVFEEAQRDRHLNEATDKMFYAAALTWNIQYHPGYDGALLNVTPFAGLRLANLTDNDTERQLLRRMVSPLMPSIPAWADGTAPRQDGPREYPMTMGQGPDGSPRTGPGLQSWNTSTYLHWLRFLTSLDHWVHTFADATEETADRATRKRYAHTARSKEPKTVTRVKLRKLEHVDTGTHDPSGRQYSHRFVVSSHWRNQPHGPGNTLRRATLIPPHIKGPADKPLILKNRVFAVDR